MDAQITFGVDGGSVRHLVLHQNGRDQKAMRVWWNSRVGESGTGSLEPTARDDKALRKGRPKRRARRRAEAIGIVVHA